MLLKQPLEFYSESLAGVDRDELQGKLIVIEGPDSVGRSTQVARLADLAGASGPRGARYRHGARRAGGQGHLAGQGRQHARSDHDDAVSMRPISPIAWRTRLSPRCAPASWC